jgi:hypothetical protein
MAEDLDNLGNAWIHGLETEAEEADIRALNAKNEATRAHISATRAIQVADASQRYIIKIEPAEEPNQFHVVEQVPTSQPPTPPAPRKRTRSIRKSIQEQNDKKN